MTTTHRRRAPWSDAGDALLRLNDGGPMEPNITWEPLPATYDQNDNGKLDPRERRALPDSAFAFRRQRELPLVDEEFVRVAIAEFGPTLDATPEELRTAAANIRAAAAHFGINVPYGALQTPADR